MKKHSKIQHNITKTGTDLSKNYVSHLHQQNIHSSTLQSALRQAHSFFKSQFYMECDL